jgi:hypothetical protein
MSSQFSRLYASLDEYTHTKRFNMRTRETASAFLFFTALAFSLFLGYGVLIGLNRLLNWLKVTPKIGPIDVPTLVTLLVVEGLVGLIGRIFGTVRPHISFLNPRQPWTIGGYQEYGVLVYNRGSDGATECQALITLYVESDEIIALPKKKVVITKRSMKDAYYFEDMPIRWVAQNQKVIDLRPDRTRMEPLVFLRVVPKRGRVPLHFEIPSEKGWSQPLVVLKARDYEGRIKVSPMNLKAHSMTFDLNFDPKTEAVKLTFPFQLFVPQPRSTKAT